MPPLKSSDASTEEHKPKREGDSLRNNPLEVLERTMAPKIAQESQNLHFSSESKVALRPCLSTYSIYKQTTKSNLV